MNDPTLDPEFASALRSELVATAAPRRSRSWRWVAGAAAAALVVVTVGVIAPQLRDEPYATPASPTSTASSLELVAASSLLLGEGNQVGLCLGTVAESRPPQCRTIPVSGITWDDVGWAETASGVSWGDAVVVGTFDGTMFTATQVFSGDDPHAPRGLGTIGDQPLPTLCDAPTRGTGASSTDALVAAAETLPGYQGLWVSPDQTTFNIAVTEDLEGARTTLAAAFGGEFCVGTVEGPTDLALSDAQQALEPLTLGPLMPGATPPADLNGGASIWGTSHTVTALGNRLEVDVVLETPELLDQIESAVGPDVWRYTDVIPFFYPVGDTTTDPTTEVPTPTPSVVPELKGGYTVGGTYSAVSGIEYRNDRVSLCYSIFGWPTRSCGASIPLLGLAPEAYPWTSGSVAKGRAFTEAQVMGTLTPEGMHVVLVNPTHGIPGTPVPADVPDKLLDAKALSRAADSLLADYDGNPYAPTTEVERSADAGWDYLVVHVLISTDEVLTDLETRLGPDVWLQTRVQPLLVPYAGDEVESMPNPASDAPTPPPSVLPQLEGTYVMQGGIEYRNGLLSLCYSIAVSEINYCKAAVPLFGLDPEKLDWEQGSLKTGHAFTHAGVAGTIESGGVRVERILDNPVGIGGPGRLPLAKDPALLPAAAADLVASYKGDAFAPTTTVDDSDPEGDRLVVHVLLATDAVVADIRQRLGEDIWQYTDVESLMSRLES